MEKKLFEKVLFWFPKYVWSCQESFDWLFEYNFDCCICEYRSHTCQKWDSNPGLQGRQRPERSALDPSAILTVKSSPKPCFHNSFQTNISVTNKQQMDKKAWNYTNCFQTITHITIATFEKRKPCHCRWGKPHSFIHCMGLTAVLTAVKSVDNQFSFLEDKRCSGDWNWPMP